MTKKVIDIYEQVLAAHEDELYLHQSTDYRDGFLDGAYVLYDALEEAGII